jgi:hypothetical protein
MEANTSVLNRYKRGLRPWRCQLTTSHSPAFPTNDLHIPPKAPPGLQFNQIPPTKSKFKIKNLRPPRDLLTTRPSTVAYIYA